MRNTFVLKCQDCKEENYMYSKNKKLHPDRMDVKKYCPVCRKHTVHKEKK
jgi:large subunit ribosomal protein L33